MLDRLIRPGRDVNFRRPTVLGLCSHVSGVPKNASWFERQCGRFSRRCGNANVFESARKLTLSGKFAVVIGMLTLFGTRYVKLPNPKLVAFGKALIVAGLEVFSGSLGRLDAINESSCNIHNSIVCAMLISNHFFYYFYYTLTTAS